MSVQQDDIKAAAGRRARRCGPAVVGVPEDPDRGYRCTVTALPSPVGDIVVLHVAGEIDLTTVAMMRTALDSALSVRQDTLVVDLSGLTFCSARGLDVLIETATVTAGRGIHYAISGASTQARRIWALLSPTDQPPDHYPTARVAVIAAIARQTARRHRVCPSARRTDARGGAAEGRLRLVPDPVSSAQDTDQQLTERARAGDTGAYRTLVRRHRARMYHSALHMLGASDDPEDVTDDIASRLHTALAAFARADPL